MMRLILWRLIFVVCALTYVSDEAYAWGLRAHEMITEYAIQGIEKEIYEYCKVSKNQLIEHSTDPDVKWKRDKRRHPNEAMAHYFHLEEQPENWKKRTESSDKSTGFLPYRIIDWWLKAQSLKKQQSWPELHEKMYGMVHYLADLTMPLHLTKEHDGKEVGLPDLHSQWEGRLITQYEKEFRERLALDMKRNPNASYWKHVETSELIFTLIEQNHQKKNELFRLAKTALVSQKKRKSKRSKQGNAPSNQNQNQRFSKPLLFQNTRHLASDQLYLASRLVRFFLLDLCGSNTK
jgi:hypothetical protein